MKRNALRFRPALSTTLKYAPNAQAAEKCRKVMALYHDAFGPMAFPERAKSFAVRLLAVREGLRMRKEGVVMRQPPTNRITYRDKTVKLGRGDCAVAIPPIVRQSEMEAAIRSV